MRILNNIFFKIIIILLLICFCLPVFNYLIDALIGFGKMVGTFIRIIGTI